VGISLEARRDKRQSRVAPEEGGDVLEQEHWRPVDADVIECGVEQRE
jgi:hypothetical protein